LKHLIQKSTKFDNVAQIFRFFEESSTPRFQISEQATLLRQAFE